MADKIADTANPLYSAAIILLFLPNLTKYVPIILVSAQTPAIARGKIIIV